VIDSLGTGAEHAKAWVLRTMYFRRSRRVRRIGITVVSIVLLFGLAGFVGVPLLAQYVVADRLAASLNRPVSMRRVRFNPYTLRLSIKKLHIGERAASAPFVDIGHLRVKVSWSSLFRLAPVVSEVAVDRPAIHIVRNAEQRFNFSDLLESSAPAPKPSEPAKPQRFAISNIQIHEGEVHFDDKVLGEQHALEHIEFDVPFIANLPADVNIFVQPLLQMVVDGSPMHIAGKAKPFAVPPESVIDLNFHRLSLPLYIGYAPKKLSLKIPQGTLSSRLQVHFVNAASAPVIRVGGEFALDQVDVRDAANAPLAGFRHLAVDLTDIEPLVSITHLGKIYLDGLTVHVVRSADGAINLTSLGGSKPAPAAVQAKPAPPGAQTAAAPTPASTPTPNAAQTPRATTPGAAQTPAATTTPAAISAQITANAPPPASNAPQPTAVAKPPTPTDISMEELELTNGAVEITDNSVAPPAALAIRTLHVGLKNLRTVGQTAPAPLDLRATLGGGGSIAVKGAIDLAHSQVTTDISLAAIDLPSLQAFAQTVLAATVAAGKLDAHANVQTRFATGRFNVHAEPASISMDKFELRAPHESESPIGWNKLSASIGQVDLATRQATVSEVRADGLHLLVRRERNGQLSLASLMREAASPEPKPADTQPVRPGASSRLHAEPPVRSRHSASAARKRRAAARAPAPPPPTPPSESWRYRVASVAIEKTEIRVEDDTMPRRIAMAVAPLNLHLKDVSNDLSKPIALDLDGVVDRKGSFKINGTAAPQPLKVNLRIATRRLNLAPLDPYVTSHLNTTIASAALTMNGALGMDSERKEMRVSYRGDATLGSVRMLDKVTNDSFLRWNSLSANGINFNLGSGPPKLHIAGLALANFYARIILNNSGRLNLRDVTANPEEAPTSLTRARPASGPGATPAPTPQPSPAAAATPAAAAAPAAATNASPAAIPAPIAADVELGRITLQGGQINYTDNFIRPNYSADLTEITGKVGSFGTRSTAPADVELQGKVNRNSPLEISGSVNPLTPMAAVDIKAKASDVELTDLSAYSTKYTGYPITKGTLTVDVHYVLAQQRLTAENHIFIDQLTFGDKVESPNALNLPIRLAVTLLKDARGQIDLHLPVSGSLSDPQFSIGSVILHVFMNLITKAITSPFSLIASAVGGSGHAEDLNYIEFAPGWASLTPASKSRLDTIAKALQARPALRLNITGRVDPKFDREGLRDALVAQSIARQKIKDSDQDESKVDLASVQITPDEYNKYLKRAYKAADFPKPRDLLGLNKSLPPDEMKKLMITNTKVTDDDLKHLADARANAVRQALSAKIDPARLIVTAPKLNADGIKDSGKTTRVGFSLE
jgi:uncharacterized protein involved in outer membrane biogenesis